MATYSDVMKQIQGREGYPVQGRIRPMKIIASDKSLTEFLKPAEVFDEEEMDDFDDWYESFTASFDNENVKLLFTPKDKLTLLCGAMKAKGYFKSKFQGEHVDEGFGARATTPEDVYINVINVDQWSEAWLVGAVATMYARNWCTGAAAGNRDFTTFFGDVGVKPWNAASTKGWPIQMLGCFDALNSGFVSGVWIKGPGKQAALIEMQLQQKVTQKAIKHFDAHYYWRADDVIAWGAQIKLAGTAELIPIAATFADAERLQAQGTQTRPTAAQ